MVKGTVVITGSTGVVGKALLDSHVLDEYNVIKCSRREKSGYCQISSLRDVPEGDWLIHLGEDSNIRRVDNKSRDYIENSYADFCSLLNSRQYNNILYLSSTVVDRYLHNNSKYELGKFDFPNYVALKLLTERKVREYGGCIVRVPNLYGEVLVPDTIWSDIVTMHERSDPISLKSPYAELTLLQIGDLIRLLGRIIDEDHKGFVDLKQGDVYLAIDLANYFISCVKGLKNGVMPSAEGLVPLRLSPQKVDQLGWVGSTSLAESLWQFVEKIYE